MNYVHAVCVHQVTADRIMVSNNPILFRMAQDLRALLMSNVSIRLYQNDPPLTQAMTLADFVEGGFGGYVRISLANVFGQPHKVQDGLYEFESTDMFFNCTRQPAGVATGMFIADGTNVYFVERFTDPIFFFPAASLQVNLMGQVSG